MKNVRIVNMKTLVKRDKMATALIVASSIATLVAVVLLML